MRNTLRNIWYDYRSEVVFGLVLSALLVVCVFAWMLFVYPTEVLRPGWLNWSHVLLQLAPLLVLSALDYFMPFDLRWLIALYPTGLLVRLIQHNHSQQLVSLRKAIPSKEQFVKILPF